VLLGCCAARPLAKDKLARGKLAFDFGQFLDQE
jgi:hypothetical protein